MKLYPKTSLAAFGYAQNYQSEPPSSIIGVPGPRWTGPLANNAPGVLVADTDEVAAAKAAHYQAHVQVLKVLPPLPPQERYQMTGIPLVQPQQPIYNNVPVQQPIYNNVPVQQPVYKNIPNYVPNQPIHTSPQFQQFAEEIPRSEIGEVPEVDAARKAHLAAYEEAKRILPKLDTTNTNYVIPVVQQPQYQNQQWQYNLPQSVLPADTPEVAAAKLEHMRLFAAALG
ncbi:hypothetical protein HHI36_011231 [Cryptolaemus montrouzieri]|uniref:Cuticular protein n=1 Tax=Cryptolaemus montrouzieri TaxID=559131 RepID=A0ABD2ML16_9CUCU